VLKLNKEMSHKRQAVGYTIRKEVSLWELLFIFSSLL